MDLTQPAPRPIPAAEISPQNSSTPNPPSTDVPRPPQVAKIRLPIVRLLIARTARIRLVAIYDDHILMGVCRRSYAISEPMLTVEGEADLTAQLRGHRRLDFNDVVTIKIHPGALSYSFTLRARHGKSLRFALPKAQAGHVSQFLREKLADRIPFHRLTTSRATAALVTLLGLFIALESMNLMGLDQRTLGVLVGALALAVTVAGLWLLFGGGTKVTRAEVEKLAATQPGRHAAPVARPPLRSKTLGWTLKLLGLAYWFLLYSPLTDPLQNWLNSQLDAQPQSYVWAVLWAPAPLLIFTGYRLCQRRYVPKHNGDSRRPILFLRPFQDDEHTSLQPSGLTAKATGLRSRSSHVRSGQTDLLDLLWSSHPVRMLRMLVDYGVGSSEESIARFFEKHGPVIAIGKPGEHLASPGAARMYLDDASWQDAVLAEMDRAQAVVMQPGPSDGVRWELTHIRDRVGPNRVLMCLISYWNNPEYFEDLSAVVADTMRIQLPRTIPYLKQPAFVYFDEAWNPHVQELSYKDPVLWPMTADGADLKYSLASFVGGMQGGAHQPPRPPRWIGGPKNWAASFAAIVLGTLLLIVPNALVSLTGRVVKIAAGGESVVAGLLGTSPQAVARSRRIILHGHAVNYQIELPEAMATEKADNAMIEQARITPDKRLEVQVVVDPKPEDLSNLPQARISAHNSEADTATAHLDSTRQFEQDGANWIESRITLTLKNGAAIREIARGASTPQGTALIVVNMLESPDSDAVYQKVADDALQSFRFENSETK